MLRIAIVEDQDQYAHQLEDYLKRFSADRGEEISVVRFTDGEDIAIGYKAEFDLILLDVQMQFMDGVTTARYIRDKDQDVMIIFISNAALYAVQGYEVEAQDYLIKPVSYFAFAQRLERAISRMVRRERTHLLVPVDGGVQKLATRDIRYVESQGHTLLYYTRGGVLESSGTMREAEQSLAPHHFYRCNKGYLVNLAHVDGMRDGFALVGEAQIPVSRSRKAGFLEALNHYVGGDAP